MVSTRLAYYSTQIVISTRADLTAVALVIQEGGTKCRTLIVTSTSVT